MSYHDVFAIAGSGMAYEQLRLDAVANNLANIHSIDTNGQPYQPLEVIGDAKSMSFSDHFAGGVTNMAIVSNNSSPKMVYEPNNPHANAQGLVAYPNVNKVDEMMTMMAAKRAYEADVKVINIAKTMALKALEIGDK
ncbi:flagellar basal body rod protein FlgC [Cysteiniphilum sp. QT6929]|uniref:flagellar basal body rod protein FlgC n=1 Tax=Cysteiniphilum sp. QT6929 TaxID=2975055 RepID=UPI0024B35842|nr:flagellar basal body rod protein FlgC [Cysteiniphilum sp. QT6929]WHN66094.1 flagellar basal body rod protein FlgC [Cysteiniphilum sp. QT6929]